MSDKSMQAFISRILPAANVESVTALPAVSRVQRVYKVTLSDGALLVLSLPPPPMMRLLRSETAPVTLEAAVLQWIARQLRLSDGPNTNLQDYLPQLITNEVDDETSIEYNLTRPTKGTAISSLSTPLTTSERKSLAYQVGSLIRQFSSLESTSRRFGRAIAVLSSQIAVRNAELTRTPELGSGETWSAAFHSLLEAALRDGEDMAVSINYSAIRRHFQRLKHVLDGVTIPRLVVVDAADDSNIMVLRSSEPAVENHDSSLRESPIPIASKSSQNVRHSERDDDEASATVTPGGIAITGLSELSNCVFGDPLYATVFSDNPSQELLRGFNGLLEQAELPLHHISDLIEDKENASTRLLLYECYHSIVRINREFYRPKPGSSLRELAARKQLSTTLSRLEQTDDHGRQRRRRLSGEMSPAKRVRPGGGDHNDDD
jgi:hypothetical protein